jgi:hypothetical protein
LNLVTNLAQGVHRPLCSQLAGCAVANRYAVRFDNPRAPLALCGHSFRRSAHRSLNPFCDLAAVAEHRFAVGASLVGGKRQTVKRGAQRV